MKHATLLFVDWPPLSQAGHSVTVGGELLTPASRLAERWLNKGGDVNRRAAVSSSLRYAALPDAEAPLH